MHVCAQVCIPVVAQRHQMCHPMTLHLWLQNGFSLNLKLCWWPESASGPSVSGLHSTWLTGRHLSMPSFFLGPEM